MKSAITVASCLLLLSIAGAQQIVGTESTEEAQDDRRLLCRLLIGESSTLPSGARLMLRLVPRRGSGGERNIARSLCRTTVARLQDRMTENEMVGAGAPVRYIRSDAEASRILASYKNQPGITYVRISLGGTVGYYNLYSLR